MATASDPLPAGGRATALLQDRRLMWLLIAIGVIMFVAVTLISFTGAYFTSTSRSPGNEFAAGQVSLELSNTGQVVNGATMIPGDVRAGSQTVTNKGHRADLVLDVLNLVTSSPLSQVLNVQVLQTSPATPNPAYDGPLAALDRVGLGTLARDDVRTFKITVTWPANEDGRELEGAQTSLDFDWQLESVP